MFLGLRTTAYLVDDLDRAKASYTDVLGKPPSFDQPYDVGFDVGGYELGLMPAEDGAAPGAGGTLAFWGVADAQAALDRLLRLGATLNDPLEDVGDGIMAATVLALLVEPDVPDA